MVDGPTNHLDLESITSVNEGLIRFSGILLITSHDPPFIQTVANRIIEINGPLVNDKHTPYDEYMEFEN